MNDLSQWLTDTETLLPQAVGPDGQLDLNSARQHQEVSGDKWQQTNKHECLNSLEYCAGIKCVTWLQTCWYILVREQTFN